MTNQNEVERYDYTVSEMTNLHSILHAAMYVPSGMPDEAMDALRAAHVAVVNKLSATPSTDRNDLRLKRLALSNMMVIAEEEGCRPRIIDTLSESIAADAARLPPAFMMAAE